MRAGTVARTRISGPPTVRRSDAAWSLRHPHRPRTERNLCFPRARAWRNRVAMTLSPSRGRLVGWMLFTVVALAGPAALAGSRQAEPDEGADDGPTEYRFEFDLTGGMHWFDRESGLGRFTDSPPELSPKTA